MIKIKSVSKSKIKFADCRLKTVDSRHILRFAYCLLSIAYLPYLLMTLMFLLTFTIELHPTIRYVSPTGNNIPPYLSWEDAANVIQDAINICEPGDTVLVDNGTYYENLVINTPISLIGLSMDSTTVDGTGLGDFTIIFNVSGSIENFNIRGKGEAVLTSRVIRSNTSFTTIEVKNCQLTNAGVGVGMVGGDVIADNLLIKNTTRGFNLFGEGENYVSNCLIILDNQNSIGISIGFSPDVNNYITNNIIIFTNPVNLTAQTGIYTGLPGKVYINNNLISGFTDNIYVDGVVDTVFIKNNALLYQYSASSNPASIHSGIHYVVVNNVVLSKNKKGINGNNRVRTDYNLFWENTTDLVGMIYGDSDRVANPMFVKDTLPNPQSDFDYHLQAFSPGIDKGDPEILDLDGSRSDIGLYGGPYGEKISEYPDLPPKPPVNLSAVIDTNGIFLKWNRNSEADTSHYNVYRDTVTNFTIDSSKLVSSQTDTFFIQKPPYESSQYVYKITCVDNQGNESLPSEEIVVKTTTVDEYPVVINDYILYQNYPNPFNPSTKIGYKLKDRGYVKLMVYDITGSLVSVLVNKEQEAGYYEVEFDASGIRHQESGIRQLASGIYLYRIEIIGEGNIPVYSDMKKMILIK